MFYEEYNWVDVDFMKMFYCVWMNIQQAMTILKGQENEMTNKPDREHQM